MFYYAKCDYSKMISPINKNQPTSFELIEAGTLSTSIIIANYKRLGELNTGSFIDQVTRLISQCAQNIHY